MLDLLIERRDEIAGLCRLHGVRRLEVSGSAVRSDVDVLVEFGAPMDFAPLHQFVGLAQALRQVLDRPVDLVEASAVKTPYFEAGIDPTRRLIYAA